MIFLLEREGDFYKKLAPSASTSAAALGVLSVAASVMKTAAKHVKDDQLVSLVNAQIGYAVCADVVVGACVERAGKGRQGLTGWCAEEKTGRKLQIIRKSTRQKQKRAKTKTE